MQGKTVTVARAYLNLLRGTALSTSTPYVGLLTTAPSNDGATGTEASYSGYARTAVTFAAPADHVEVAGKQIITNNADVELPVVAGSDLDVVAVGIYDAASAGTLLFWAEMIETIPVGQTPRFPAGDLGIVED